jgi:hydrogenase-4 component F
MNLAAQFPLLIPLLAFLATLGARGPRPIVRIAATAAVACWAFALWAGIVRPRHLWDALGLWYVLMVAVLGGFCLLASTQYVLGELQAGEIGPPQVRRYFLLFHLGLLSLLAIGTAASYFTVWAGVEGATLATVLLVALPGGARSVEAAWKYVVVTGIGGLLALLGTVLVLQGAGLPLAGWGFHLPGAAVDGASARTLAVGFWLALVGYGSKAGLVPFHTWLPDAHSEAPAPVSAILSGIKLAGGLYGLLRLLAVATVALGPLWPHRLLIAAGLASLALAGGALAGQRDLKRLLAYSSIEHMGVIALGAGFGGLGLAGALLHMWTHGLGKTGLFFGSGNVRLRYHATGGPRVRGLLAALPLTGSALALGAVAIVGLPPFGLFWSEWLVLVGGIRAGDTVWVAVAAALLLLAFVGIGLRLPDFLLGAPPGEVAAAAAREPAVAVWLIGVELALLAAAGLLLPGLLGDVWQAAVRLGGG